MRLATTGLQFVRIKIMRLVITLLCVESYDNAPGHYSDSFEN